MRHFKTSLLFRDIIFNALLLFVAATIILLPHVNPIAKDAREIAPGTMSVEIRWDDARNVDVDLWMLAPGDIPVGYSRQSGVVFNLLRDDLGHRNDFLKLNYENGYARGLPNGTYVINIHYYLGDGLGPIEVAVLIKVNGREVVSRKAVLEFPRDQVTLFQIEIADGLVLSTNQLYRKVAPFD